MNSILLQVGTGKPRARVLIVDDHPIFREGLTQSLSREEDLAVCGEAENAAQALEAVLQLAPDLAIVDITLPGKSGLDLIREIRALRPKLPVLAVSMHDENLYASRTLRAGARGYVMKQESPKVLLQAIRHVLEGGIYVSPKMSSQILESYSAKSPRSSSSPIEQLSEREFEIFHLVGQGRSNQEIAQHLHLSFKTVAVHEASIRRKLNLANLSDLVRFAVRWQEARD